MISVFKTNIEMSKDVFRVLLSLKKKLGISAATIDLEDEEHILRLEHLGKLGHEEVTETIENEGFFCEELTD